MRYFSKRNIGYFTALFFAVLGFVDYKNLLVSFWPSVDFFKKLSLIRTSSDLIYFWTLLAIILYVRETQKSTKFLEYQIRPTAYPLLLNAKVFDPQAGMTKDKTMFYIKNDSKFKILFYCKIISKSGKLLSDRWNQDPIHVYPLLMNQYPDVIDSIKVIDGLSIDIKYRMAPSHAPSRTCDEYPVDTWRFEKGEWIGPNGIRPVGVMSLINFFSGVSKTNITNPDLKVSILNPDRNGSKSIWKDPLKTLTILAYLWF